MQHFINSLVHGRVELVKVLVSELLVVREVELAPGVVIGVAVASAGEVKPFGVTWNNKKNIS